MNEEKNTPPARREGCIKVAVSPSSVPSLLSNLAVSTRGFVPRPPGDLWVWPGHSRATGLGSGCVAPAIHAASNCSQAWGCWVVRRGCEALGHRPGTPVVISFVVHPSYPPCDQGFIAVGTGGGSALSALRGGVSYNPVSGG